MAVNAGILHTGTVRSGRSIRPARAAISAFVLVLMPMASLADGIIARVNGKPILESEMALADAEIGTDLGSLPDETKRRVLVEYLIETQLMAEAAERASLGNGATFDQRLRYWRRKALRDAFFDSRVKALVTDADARRSFDAQVAGSQGQVQVKARHILVDSEDKAKEIVEKIAHGAEFADMARQYSNDPGSRDNGGSLGYFGRGQMVPQFEEAAFKLAPGEFSQPVKTQFGWHIIKVDDKRESRPPSFEAVKKQVLAGLVHQKALSLVNDLRARASIEYVDPALKAHVERERMNGPGRQ